MILVKVSQQWNMRMWGFREAQRRRETCRLARSTILTHAPQSATLTSYKKVKSSCQAALLAIALRRAHRSSNDHDDDWHFWVITIV